MNNILIAVLIFFEFLFADIQLIKDHHIIIIKDGQKFSINDDKKKYKFESIDFELELINNTFDIKYINKISIYTGNLSKEFAIGPFILCIFMGLESGLEMSAGNSPPKKVIHNIAEITFQSMPFFVSLSVLGYGLGYFFNEKKEYIISDDEWRFIP